MGGVNNNKDAPGLTIENCYNAGKISGTGGMAISGSTSQHVVMNCYYDKDTSVRGDSKATAFTTAQMKSWVAAYKLNEETFDGVWKYNMGAYPTFGSLAPFDWEKAGEALECGFLPADKTKPSGGGTPENPYQIKDAEQLAWFAYRVNSGTQPNACATLMNDINVTGTAYTGTSGASLPWIPIRNYSGTFGARNTDRFEVSGLHIDTTADADANAGLFATATGTISNIAVVDSTLVSSGGSQGAIAGILDGGAIFQCYSRGNEGGGAWYAGGIVGQLMGAGAEIRDCYNLETQLEAAGADSAAGGIAGDGSAGKIQNCYNACLASGFVRAEESAGGTAGSIAGKTGTGNLIQCYSDTDLSDSSQVTMFDTSSDAKRLEQTAGLNTYNGVERKGTDRVWYTSLVDEKTKGYPTFDAPVMLAVAVDPAKVKEVDGNVTGSIGEISGGTLPSSLLFRGIHQEKAADTEPVITLENKDNVTAQFHLSGTNSAHTQLSLIAGDQDLAGRNGSLIQPTDSITSFSAMTLYNGASYVYPYKRTLVVDLVAKTAAEGITDITRYEITVEIAAVTGKTLDVTMKAQTMMELQPGVTGTAYTEDLELVNGNPYPIQLKISSLDPIQVGKDVVLQPIAKEQGIHNEKPLTEDGVRLGITKPAEGEDTGKLGTVGDLYYEPGENENPGTWMKGSLGSGSILRYRYFMKHSLLHVGPQQTFGFKITYEFRIPAENPEPGVSVSAG